MNHKYTEQEHEFLRKNVKGITLKELTERFNKEFNCSLSESKIASIKSKLKLKNGINGGQFKKGHVSHNKGKKWDDYLTKEQQQKAKEHLFKKGNITYNHRNLYEERITKDGYIEIKVKEPNIWMLKARYIYEKNMAKYQKDIN